jgi:hypothetical protein
MNQVYTFYVYYSEKPTGDSYGSALTTGGDYSGYVAGTLFER